MVGIHRGSNGARPPHAIVEDPTTGRTVQEGAIEVEIPMQHPYAVVGKEELEDQHLMQRRPTTQHLNC